MSFWNTLPKPIIVLAPLADVTDASFRRLIAKHSAHQRADGTVGGPDIMWTEFVSADGLMRASEEGRAKLMKDLMYTQEERPIIAQLFSANEEYMEGAARLCHDLGFDGIDINMGCPDRSIEKQGCGAAMIKNPENARAVIRAAKRGAGGLPVSVKTRLGYNKDELEEWIPELLAEDPAAITVHARTRKEMSKVPACWERVARAVEIRDEHQSSTLILGNGDVMSVEDARQKAEETGVDGVMLGRAIFGNPWLFHPSKRLPERIALSASSSATHRNNLYGSDAASLLPRSPSQQDALNNFEIVSLEERLRVLVEHTRLFEELLPHKNFAIMKKHYKAYVNGFDGAKELRVELMGAENADQIERIVSKFISFSS
jgi:tRNA-dihydrouridine synthase